MQWKRMTMKIFGFSNGILNRMKQTCQDPKDGELYLNGLKPKETLVEEPRSVNVQITCHIWV